MGDNGSTPPAAGPAGRRWVAALAAVIALFAAGAAHKEHTVQPGDTLDEIAQRHGTTVSVLMGENPIEDPNRIEVGSVISIPDGSGTTHHVVRPGETLAAIGERYGVSASQLAEWNNLQSAAALQAGQRLSVSGPAAEDVAGGGGGTHHITAGETLSGIAARFGVGVSDITQANEITDPNRIIAGATLTIPGGWHCPVDGAVTFINDFGVTKQSGRFHDGVDLFAPRGTPVVAPVAGHVEQVRGPRAGLQFRLHGVDGHVYIGTHLEAFGSAGDVQAGEVIGTVGNTGNAVGTSPHLHFEIHIDGERLTNPYPSLRNACG
jgi:murein DD-endopeptidase MepM/ murein hydrolase activator NlpD